MNPINQIQSKLEMIDEMQNQVGQIFIDMSRLLGQREFFDFRDECQESYATVDQCKHIQRTLTQKVDFRQFEDHEIASQEVKNIALRAQSDIATLKR